MYSLRTATIHDLPFLFNVSTKAMLPVRKVSQPDLTLDLEKEFKEYSEKFVPEKIKVIQFEGSDVGRLRLVTSSEEIYVGGIQILPEFQDIGIGSAIFADLVKKADKLQIPIRLEVSKVNEGANRFYKKFGFSIIGEKGTDLIMRYKPKRS